MARTPTKLMTFAEFEQIPDPPGGRYELYHGELVSVAFPEQPHTRAQWQIRRLLESSAADAGIVHTEMPYRPLPEYEGWRADVAYVSKARWENIDRYLMGAPEIVIEVLSPANRASELADKSDICLANGSLQFWIVDTDLRRGDVFKKDCRFASYKSGQEVPRFDGTLTVDAIFA